MNDDTSYPTNGPYDPAPAKKPKQKTPRPGGSGKRIKIRMVTQADHDKWAAESRALHERAAYEITAKLLVEGIQSGELPVEALDVGEEAPEGVRKAVELARELLNQDK